MKEQAPKPVAVVVDDEAPLRRLLRIALENAGYQVIEAANAQSGLTEIAHGSPQVVILDLGLPDMSGMDVIPRIREWSDVPIIVLSVREDEQDKIEALQRGADDYVTKPFGTGELLARMAVARRHLQMTASAAPAVFRSGPLEVDLAARRVKVSGNQVKLTATEYALLRLFLRNPGKVLTHPQILEAVWGPANIDKTHYLHVYLTHLREKIEPDPEKPQLLMTERRVGYWLNTNLPAASPTGVGLANRPAPEPVQKLRKPEMN